MTPPGLRGEWGLYRPWRKGTSNGESEVTQLSSSSICCHPSQAGVQGAWCGELDSVSPCSLAPEACLGGVMDTTRVASPGVGVRTLLMGWWAGQMQPKCPELCCPQGRLWRGCSCFDEQV